jgi:carbamoyltransferase
MPPEAKEKRDYVLGISAFYHDSAACLIREGEIIAAAQEERFSRKKHDEAYPARAIEYCLKEGGVKPADLALVAFYEKPFLKFDRILHSYLGNAPSGLGSFLKSIPLWIKKKIWLKDQIAKQLGFGGRIVFPEHHESHAASAFYPSPFQEAAIVTVDGVGEWTTTSIGQGRGNQIELEYELKFPHSLGLLYSAFTYYCGFKVNSGEYKLMGLAPYGEAKYKEKILGELIDLKGDGSFRLNMRYFDFETGSKMISGAFADLFGGPPREPEGILRQRDMDLARSIQEVTEEVMYRIAVTARERTGQKNLCLAGGVALNCVANGRILREKIFERIWIQPAAGDAGGALGAALFAWHNYLGKSRSADGEKDSQKGSLLGPSHDEAEIAAFLKKENVAARRLEAEEIAGVVADLIAAEKVVGWFQGRMEFGPRALGARSILGDARSPQMQERMNLKIKFRESFRPFAPAVLESEAKEWFELEQASPYMLLVAPVAEERRLPEQAGSEASSGLEKLQTPRSTIPAVTHVDYSARVQTVDRERNPGLFALLEKFQEKFGCPLVINTSFNVRGEPMVCSPEDACRCFMRTNMDYLLLGNYLLEKTEQKPLDKDAGWLRQHELD